MPHYPGDPEHDLREAIDRGAVIVAGTGVSIAASLDPATGNPHPQASWAGLLESGLEWLTNHDLIKKEVAQAHLTLLRNGGSLHHFIAAAQDVTQRIGGVESQPFAEWLARTVGSIKAHDRKVLDALHLLGKHGNLLATTNYDGLLLDHSYRPVNWDDPDAFLRAARNDEKNKIVFLHGYWRNPSSVILDWISYDKITRDEDYRQQLAAVWQMKTWVYVGCGVNGLSDPDFGLLLERYGKRARIANLWDFCLVRRGDRDEFQAHFDNQQINICAVPFGDSHDDLPQFLRSLLPVPAPVIVNVLADPVTPPSVRDSIPTPPSFYAEPDYIGSHKFVGRDAELQLLSDWAKPADPTNLLLFEAIGGNGKSMLTWEWTTNHATKVRTGADAWAGRFWYSFYERGAIMADFCRRALAYMTGRPLEEFAKKKTTELAKDLLAQLHDKPWLLILDGLERVLVAYHRIDAAEIPEEEANKPTDKIVDRNPCDAIRDEDNDLLRLLAAAAPSKILVSSRLTPRVLLNPSGQPLPGAKRITLPGLRPPDAELLLRSCGIDGESAAIQNYLTANCDNHPLVIGVLAGLINNYLPVRGNFDAWVIDSEGGAKLDLASLDLTQSRNHILRAALQDLPLKCRQLLSTLALISESVDYETLKAFNPHLPPEPEEIMEPVSPDSKWDWKLLSAKKKDKLLKQHKTDLANWKEYQDRIQARLASMEYRDAAQKLKATVVDLEQRGLLQYDGRTRRHDLHPVVRAVAAGGMQVEEKERFGERVVDHFSSVHHSPYDEAETLEDLRPGLTVVRTLLKLGDFSRAAKSYRGDLANALVFNVEANAEVLSLLRPFFHAGWGELPKDMDISDASYLAIDAGIALKKAGESNAALAIYGLAVRSDLESGKWRSLTIALCNITGVSSQKLSSILRLDSFALDLAEVVDEQELLFSCRLSLFVDQALVGLWEEASALWRLLDPMGRMWSRAIYRLGHAEWAQARFQYWQGTLQESILDEVERLATEGKTRVTIRLLHSLRGAWLLEKGEWTRGTASFAEAVRMARENGISDVPSETGLALAKYHLGQLSEPQVEAERLTQLRDPAHRLLAQLWLAIGDTEKAKHHALAAYKWAWAEGEPYVYRFELTKTTELLQQMNVPIPNLPPYDPTKDEPYSWEADVRAVIEKLRAEKEAKKDKTN